MKYLIPFLLVVLTSTSCTNNQKNNENKALVKASMDANAQTLLNDPTITSVSIGILKDGIAYTPPIMEN